MNPCTSFITYVLILPHPAPVSKRIRITSVSMPNGYVQAWHQYQRLAREYMNLTFMVEDLRRYSA